MIEEIKDFAQKHNISLQEAISIFDLESREKSREQLEAFGSDIADLSKNIEKLFFALDKIAFKE